MKIDDGRNTTKFPWWSREEDDTPYLTGAQVIELETKVERLSESFKRWARHLDNCPARLFGSDPNSCRCGLQQQQDGSLWEAGDHSDLKTALSFLQD